MAFLGVAFLALASARMALASFAAAFSMPAFLWENLVPNGWSSSEDSRVAVSLMEEGSFEPFFLAIGSSSLSGSIFWCFDFGRLACIGQPTAVCKTPGESCPTKGAPSSLSDSSLYLTAVWPTELRDLRLAVPLGVESISMRSLTAPWRIETPGGAGRALEADLSISRSVEGEMVGADAF
jgi:hypothetical protein